MANDSFTVISYDDIPVGLGSVADSIVEGDEEKHVTDEQDSVIFEDKAITDKLVKRDTQSEMPA